ncbi:hypothetical protein [Serinicoccus marinus]|uniref:hypothetical protein n=1 Tax=Serinicoccus marinus TaxID=247333 RepID=UPI0024924E0D|nr:hypothetical protein [Serinicoccus marinus]
MQVTELEPGTRWTATDGAHEAGAFLGRLHRTHGWLSVEPDVPPETLRDLATALSTEIGLPLVAKAVPGTARHDQLVAAGARAYQSCPPSEVDGGRPDNTAWAAAPYPDGVQVGDVTELGQGQVLDLFLQLYTWVHEEWGPLTDELAAREHFGPMLEEALARELSVVTLRKGTATALAYALRDGDGPLCVVAEAVDPTRSTALEDVAIVMREVVRRTAAAGAAMYFDGHVSDPHYPRVLATIPTVTGSGLDLLRLG